MLSILLSEEGKTVAATVKFYIHLFIFVSPPCYVTVLRENGKNAPKNTRLMPRGLCQLKCKKITKC